MKTDTEHRTFSLKTTTYRASLLIEALEIAQNSYEYDGEQHKAEALALLISDIKEGK